jgi:hypothetical protein
VDTRKKKKKKPLKKTSFTLKRKEPCGSNTSPQVQGAWGQLRYVLSGHQDSKNETQIISGARWAAGNQYLDWVLKGRTDQVWKKHRRAAGAQGRVKV